MSSPNDPTDPTDPAATAVERPRLDVLQLAAGALAATTAAVIGSRLGVNGTVVGAAVGSVVGTVGSAGYAHYLRRTATRVRTVVVGAPGTSPSRPDDVTTAMETVPGDTAVRTQPEPADETRRPSVRPIVVTSRPTTTARGRHAAPRRKSAWPTVALAVVATFLVSLAAITVFELLANRSVSSLTGGDPERGGTTITKVLRSERADPVPSESPVPRPTVTTTVTPTAAPTTTGATPSASPTPTDTTPATQTPPAPTTPVIPTPTGTAPG